MLIKSDQSLISSYLEDTSNIKGGNARAVYFPENEREVTDIILQSAADKEGLTVSGAGTGVAGSRVPFGGIVLATDKLNKIIALDEKNGLIRLQPGVMLKQIHQSLAASSFAYNPDSTEKGAFIGGNVATNASGARAFKYGSTRKYVNALNVVLSSGGRLNVRRGQHFAQGRILTLDGLGKINLPDYRMPEIKNSAGYFIKDDMDLIDLFIGQEGTLGVITEIELRLVPKAEKTFGCLAFFPDENNACDFAEQVKIISKQGNNHMINALSLEFFDRHSLSMLRQAYPKTPNAGAGIFFEQETTDRAEGEMISAWLGILERFAVPENMTWFADTPAKQANLYEFRWKLPELVNELIKKRQIYKIGTDMAVPDSSFKKIFNTYLLEANKSGMQYLIFGHIGDNHLHVNLLPKNQAELEKAKSIYETLVKTVISVGGTPSAEHGIGKTKHAYLKMLYGENGIRQMADLKKRLDPSGILGLGNLFPQEYLS